MLAALLDPYIRIANALPRVVLAPIFLLWFGLGIWSKVALGVTVVFFVVFFNTYRGIREVDRAMIDNARMLGASKYQLARHVLIPSALTWIFSSLHVSIGMAIVAVVVGDTSGPQGVSATSLRRPRVFLIRPEYSRAWPFWRPECCSSEVWSRDWSTDCSDGNRSTRSTD